MQRGSTWKRIVSGSALFLLLWITAAIAWNDDRVLLVWLTLGLPLGCAAWAFFQRGFSGNVVFGALAAVFAAADVMALLASPEACCYAVVLCGIHGATAVLCARLARYLATARRARFYASVRRGLATFRELKRAPRSAYR